MKLLLVVLIALCVAECLAQGEKGFFLKFQKDHNKAYKTEAQFRERFEIFQKNLQAINKMNEGLPQKIYGITKFADLSPEEFAKTHLRCNKERPDFKLIEPSESVKSAAIPTSFDWRNHNPPVVTGLKNEGQCGDPCVISTVEEIESICAIAGHNLTVLSQQQILDCDPGINGCEGGNSLNYYDYVIKAGGLESEAEYPFNNNVNTCQFNPKQVVASIASWGYVTKNQNETQMMNSLYNLGPLNVAVDASSWQFYQGGIVTSNCRQNIDSCAQITGYGEEQGVPFWTVRNVWGADWGENGYIRIARNRNLCGIAMYPSLCSTKQ